MERNEKLMTLSRNEKRFGINHSDEGPDESSEGNGQSSTSAYITIHFFWDFLRRVTSDRAASSIS